MDKQGIVLKTEYDAKAAFPTPYMGEQERRFFHALCYAVGAEKALLQAVLRVCIWRGKGFIPYSPKPRFYCVTNPKQAVQKIQTCGGQDRKKHTYLMRREVSPIRH